MIDQLFKVLGEERGRVIIQWGTFISIVGGAFYFGLQTKDFVNAQTMTAKSISSLEDTMKKFMLDRWTYQMQREYNTDLKNNNSTLIVPNLSEIREKHLFED